MLPQADVTQPYQFMFPPYKRDEEEQKKHVKSRAEKAIKRARRCRSAFVLHGAVEHRERTHGEMPGDFVVSRDFKAVYVIDKHRSRRRVTGDVAAKAIERCKELLDAQNTGH